MVRSDLTLEPGLSRWCRLDDLRVTDAGQLGALFGEAPDEVSERLVWLLAAALKIPGVPRAHICALEVSDKDPNQVAPVVDL